MINVKSEIEKYFQDNWHHTAIQWDGVPFHAVARWVKLEIIPTDRKLYAYDGQNGRKEDTLVLRVSSFDSNPHKAMALEEEVRTFIECYKGKGSDFHIGIGVPSGDGAVPLDNGTFIITSLYDIIAYN